MRQLLRKYFPQWFPVEKVHSDYNTLEVVSRDKKLILNAPHVNYSFGTLHQVFKNAFRQLNPDYRKIENVLILGFGAGSVATILQKENHCGCHITGVEIDEKVIALAKKYFRLDELENPDLHIADAADFLSKDAKQYDLIVVDLFLDHRTPDEFLTMAFLGNLYAHLQLQGIVMFNYLPYDFEAKEKAVEFEKEFGKIFQQVRLLTFSKQLKNIVFTGKR
jgi:spermidine synthase